MPIPALIAESTVEWIVGISVATILAIVGGFAIGYSRIKSALREEKAKDAKQERDDKKADNESELEQLQRENSIWHAECLRIIDMYNADRQRWATDMREVRLMVDAAEKQHRDHRERCDKDIGDLQRRNRELEFRISQLENPH